MSQFVHLHGHSEYSLLDGMSKIKKMVKATKEMGMNAIALTDHGSMYGCIEFYKACTAEGIKPIIGCELYVARRSHKDKEGKVDTEPYHLTVLAKNFKGYQNLMKLVSIGYLDGYYYKPRVDRALLKEYSEGLIVLSGCPAGEFLRSLKDGDFKEGEKVAREYLEIFGEGNYFLEIQNHEYEKVLTNSELDPAIRQDLTRMNAQQKLQFEAIKQLSPKLGIPVVATNDFHYVNFDDAPAQDALVCVQTGRFIKEINRLRMIDVPNFYIRPPQEMEELFKEIPDATINTQKVSDSVQLEMTLGKPIFPIFDIPTGKTAAEHLRDVCADYLKEKFPDNEEYKKRLDYELDVIESKNFSTYFLIFHDFVHWAHRNKIITNTRGSAAGSLVLYLLGITNLDPIQYRLPFERFMNPLRPKLPDIDCDIADDKRDEVIRYLINKYGEDKVAHIVTFGTMMGRAAIRDIGRVLAIPYAVVDKIAKYVPPPHQGFHKPLADALVEVPELANLYRLDPEAKVLLDLAQKVEGTVRHASVHAAGVVISPEVLTNYTPLQRESNGDKIVTQYDMFSVTEDYEGVGLIKMDLLGIRNLAILGHAVEIVKESLGIEVDLGNLPIDDKKTYELLGRGDTMGLFQIEGSGMTRYLMELKPTNFFDIMAMIALYRPGPLASIPEYIGRKHDPSKVTFFDPRMKSYMEQSLGLLVYQEDVLLTAINIAGYNWLEADKLRKAMGKKNPEEMAKEKEHFIHGCIENGMSEEKAKELFGLIEPFAAYGFGKAHAASYAMVSYQTAYMKANYPVEFMSAVMTAEYGDTDKITRAVQEATRLGIVILPPDVNKSMVGFSIENISKMDEEEIKKQIGGAGRRYNKAIRFGMSAIKNVGFGAIESIIEARKNGEFKTLPDMCAKVDNRLVNKKTLDSLIKSGAMDNLGKRSANLLILDECLEKVHAMNKKGMAGQVGLFAEDTQERKINIEIPDVDELPNEELLNFEKELLGFYLHEPPFLQELAQLGNYCSHKVSTLSEDVIGMKISVGGVITEVKRVVTKKDGSEMCFLRISDTVETIDVVVFPKLYAEMKSILNKDTVIVVWARADKREDQLSLVADKISKFDPDHLEGIEKEVEIVVPEGSTPDVLQKINRTLREYPGRDKVAILLPNGGNNIKRLSLPFGVKSDHMLMESIEDILGKGAVRLT